MKANVTKKLTISANSNIGITEKPDLYAYGRIEIADFIDIKNSNANESSNFKIKEMYGGLNKILVEKCENEISFEIKSDELTLYYNCFEGCGEKFKRVN